MEGTDYNEGYIDGRNNRRPDFSRNQEYRRGYVDGKKAFEADLYLNSTTLGDGYNAFRNDFED